MKMLNRLDQAPRFRRPSARVWQKVSEYPVSALTMDQQQEYNELLHCDPLNANSYLNWCLAKKGNFK